jgi:WD40 repeat protein
MCRAPIARLIVLVWAAFAALAPAQEPVGRTDAVGDPLPPGALFRLGTVRWRTGTTGWRDAATLSADGRTVFAANDRGDIRAFDLESGALTRTLRGHDGGVNTIAVSHDGKLLASTGSEKAFLWDLDAGKALRALKVRSVSAMAFSPDGKKLITGGDDHEHSIRVIDVASGKETLRLLWHQRRVIFVGCGPDNKTLVTASWDNHVRITDLSTGEAIHTFGPANGSDTVVALAADGKTLGVSDMRYQQKQPHWIHTIRLIDVATGTERRTVAQGTQRISSLAFTPDSKSLVAVGDDARVYDVKRGKALRTLPGVHGGRFTPDGRHLVSIGGMIRVWDFATGQELHPPEGPRSAADSLTFAPDGKTLATSGFSDNGAIHLWDAASGKFRGTLTGHDKTSYVRAVQFMPDGRLVSGGGDSTIRVWDVGAAKELFQFKLHEPRAGEERLQVVSLHVAADGKTVAAAATGFGGPGSKEGTKVFAWDLAHRKRIAHHEQTGAYFGDWPGFSADARAFLARDEKGMLLRDMASGKELLRFQPQAQPSGEGVLNANILESPYTFSPDGKVAAVRGSRQRHEGQRYWRDQYRLVLFDLSSGKELHRITVDRWSTPAAFSPDSKRLAAVDGPGVRIWDVATRKKLWETPALDAHVTALAFSPDGRRLATALGNITVLFWDVGDSP